MDFYRRLRHTYGFGVHSPRAFRLVKDLLRPAKELRWYGYEDIEFAIERWVDSAQDSSIGHGSQHALRSDSRLLLRLAAWLEVGSVWIPSNVPSPMLAAVKAADSRMHIYNKEKDLDRAELVVAIGHMLPAEKLLHVPHKGIVVFRSAPENVAGIVDSVAGGVMLRGRCRSVILPSAGDPLHLYDVL